MSQSNPPTNGQPNVARPLSRKDGARQQRLEKALRANLQRRKQRIAKTQPE